MTRLQLCNVVIKTFWARYVKSHKYSHDLVTIVGIFLFWLYKTNYGILGGFFGVVAEVKKKIR